MNTRKKLIGGLMAAMIIATIGAAIATAQTGDTTTTTTPQVKVPGTEGMNRFGPCGYNLTTEQQTELQQLITTLKDQNATGKEIRAAVEQKLEKFGVFDAQLDEQITQTQQRFTILNREKELRNQGYNWTEVRQMIQDEFGLQNSTAGGYGALFDHGPDHGSCKEPFSRSQDFSSNEKREQ